ncbi:hypothetical protein HAX54_002609, partial [Datura stramonium]|nr:hypothetical protein [Datura stramonium]
QYSLSFRQRTNVVHSASPDGAVPSQPPPHSTSPSSTLLSRRSSRHHNSTGYLKNIPTLPNFQILGTNSADTYKNSVFITTSFSLTDIAFTILSHVIHLAN